MEDTTIKKVDSRHSPVGDRGQKYLASGVTIAMRLWENESPRSDKDDNVNPYETVGYVIDGRAKLHSEGQTILLQPGDSWVLPEGARHRYEILEPFTAVEATHPPARVGDRDEN